MKSRRDAAIEQSYKDCDTVSRLQGEGLERDLSPDEHSRLCEARKRVCTPEECERQERAHAEARAKRQLPETD